MSKGISNANESNKKKKNDNLKELEELIIALLEAGEEVDIPKLQEIYGKSRQYYYLKHVKELRAKYKIGKEFKEYKRADSEYLYESLKNKNAEITLLKEKIETLNFKLLDEKEKNKGLDLQYIKLKNELKDFKRNYYKLLSDYNIIRNDPKHIEPIDIIELSET